MVAMIQLMMVELPQLQDRNYTTLHTASITMQSLSLNTGFNMMVFFFSLLTTLLEKFNIIDFNDLLGPGLAWLVARAVTPTIRITRNKKMMDLIKQIDSLFHKFNW